MVTAKFNLLEREWEVYLDGSLFCYLSNEDFDYFCEHFSKPVKVVR